MTKGTLILQNVPEALQIAVARTSFGMNAPSPSAHRPYRYRKIVSQLRAYDIPYQDTVRQFTVEPFTHQKSITPYSYQTEAIDAWHANGKRGVISLPTGAGKTFIAILLIAETQRPTLVHVPTIDLMHQLVYRIEGTLRTRDRTLRRRAARIARYYGDNLSICSHARAALRESVRFRHF